MTTPDLSVLIVNYNGQDQLPGCLRALHSALGSLSAEIIIVDNASTDGSREMLRSTPAVRLIEAPENEGFARAMNRALPVATGRVILWLNPDCVLEEGSLPAAIRALEESGAGVAMGPRLVGDDGRTQPSALAWSSPMRAVLHALGARRLFRLPGSAWAANWISRVIRPGPVREYLLTLSPAPAPRETDWLTGACLLMPGAVARHVGPLDEAYFMYSEDEAWCRKAAAAGVRRVWHPSWVARHAARASGRGSPYIKCHYYRSLWIYQRNYGGDGTFVVATALLWVSFWGGLRELVRAACGARDARIRARLWIRLAWWVLRGRGEPCGQIPPPAWPPPAWSDRRAV